MRRVIAVVAIVAAVAGLAACGDDEESQATAEQNLCASLSDFSAAVVNLQGLNVQTASKDDYEAAAQQIEDAWNQVRQDAKDVREADTAALDQARQDLSQALDDVPEDVPVADAVAGVQAQVQQVAQTWRETFDGLGCGLRTNAGDAAR